MKEPRPLVECSVAPMGAPESGEPTATVGSSHRGRIVALADAVGQRAQGSGSGHRAVQAFLSELGEMPVSRENATLALQRAFATANEAATATDGASGVAAAPDAVSLVAALFLPDEAIIAHVGNARCYSVRDRKLSALTKDHSAIETLSGGGPNAPPPSDPFLVHHRDLLTRALGLAPVVTPEISSIHTRQDDRFILCTSGIWTDLSEEHLLSAVIHPGTPSEVCRLLHAHMLSRESGYAVAVIDLVRNGDEERAA